MQSECTSQLESPDELEKEADNDDDDGVASVTSSVNSSTSLMVGRGHSGTGPSPCGSYGGTCMGVRAMVTWGA